MDALKERGEGGGKKDDRVHPLISSGSEGAEGRRKEERAPAPPPVDQSGAARPSGKGKKKEPNSRATRSILLNRERLSALEEKGKKKGPINPTRASAAGS